MSPLRDARTHSGGSKGLRQAVAQLGPLAGRQVTPSHHGWNIAIRAATAARASGQRGDYEFELPAPERRFQCRSPFRFVVA